MTSNGRNPNKASPAHRVKRKTKAPAPGHAVLRLGSDKAKPALSPAQKTFNRMTKRIAAERNHLADWQAVVVTLQQTIAESYLPLQQRYFEQRVEWVQLLDKAYKKAEFRPTERKKIEHLIGTLTEGLLAERDDASMKALYKKYTKVDFDTEREEVEAIAGEFMKEMFEDLFDVRLDEESDLSTPEKAHAAFEALMSDEEARAEKRKASRKKSPKQLEKEAHARDEAQKVSQSIQAVFRKLAAALHPDREPDPAERERKTELMQRVNVAYGKRDLLQLLELQLQVEQIDQTHLDQLTDERLRYINKVLKEQLGELMHEIFEVQLPIKQTCGLPPFAILTPKGVQQQLKHDIRDLREAVEALAVEIETAREVASLKSWLKDYRIPKKPRYDEEGWDPFETLPPF